IAALPLFKRATEIDPKFAMAYVILARNYGAIGETGLSAECTSKAYQLRDRATDREKFNIAASYDIDVTGNLEKAQQTCQLWAQTYPREAEPHAFLGGIICPTLGKYEKGVEAARKTIELNPDFAMGYLQLEFHNQFLDRLGEAENALQKA